MNEVQIHDAVLKTDNIFDKLDQDQNHLISQTELSDFIAKNPTDVDNVTAAKFMLDNFQLVSNLEKFKEYQGSQIPGQGISHDDLDNLKLLTEADGDGVQRLLQQRELSKAMYGSGIGAAIGWTTLGTAAAVDALPEVVISCPPSVIGVAALAVGAAVGAGIGYELAKHEETTKYETEQKQINALYTS